MKPLSLLPLLILLLPTATAKVQYAGVNIAGCDFGCDTNGSCSGGGSCPPTNFASQMQHFASSDGLNIFRLPFGWPYATNYVLGGTLDANFMSGYDSMVQSCLSTGAACILDAHNYARWYGGIVGQSGVTTQDLVSLWSQLATRYATTPNIIFGLMNEPHDLDMGSWAGTMQAVVTAIRAAGATSQLILLPGTDYTSAGAFATASGPALSSVVDADGSTGKLVFDVHQYLDSDGSGTHAECVTDGTAALQGLAAYLRQEGRRALLSETGGGNTASCAQNVCAELSFLNANADVFLGWVGWAAGAFDSGYVLSETPDGEVDQMLVTQCVAGMFH